MKIVIEQEKCVASGQCVLAAGEVFDQDDDGIVVLLDEAPGSETHDRVREAAALCPTTAIRLVGT